MLLRGRCFGEGLEKGSSAARPFTEARARRFCRLLPASRSLFERASTGCFSWLSQRVECNHDSGKTAFPVNPYDLGRSFIQHGLESLRLVRAPDLQVGALVVAVCGFNHR